MITTSIPILLVENCYFFVLLVLSFFHANVHGQCPATAKYNLTHTLKLCIQYSSRATSRARVLASLATRVPHAIHTQAPVQMNCGVALGL